MTTRELGGLEAFSERYRAANQSGMPEWIARTRMSAAEIRALQTHRLRELLAYVADRSPFWAERLAGVDCSRFELADLARLPVVTKRELMADLDGVFTDRRLSRALAERALSLTTPAPVPVFGEYLVQATGGSSGERGIFVSDAETLSEVLSAPLRTLLSHSAGLGVVATVAAATAVHSTGIASALNQPGKSPIALHAVPVTLPLAEIVARLTEIQPHRLVGYPSMLARLAREKREGRLPISPLVISTTSEMLSPELREQIRSGFEVPIVNVFGSTEGLMGSTDPDDSVFSFNSDTCIVEPVDANERPVPPGVASDHVLITNLANRVQPLIRYRLDDSFTQQPDSPAHGLFRATVEGRSNETLRWGKLEIHPLVIRAVLLKHPEVVDYQVRQTPCGVDLRIVSPEPSRARGLDGEVSAALVAAGLCEAQVTVTRVESLERNRETGKLRRFVPL